MAKTKLPFFSRKMAELRQARGWSVYRLAQETGITAQALANVEAGAMPSLANAAKIAEALGVPLSGELVEQKTE